MFCSTPDCLARSQSYAQSAMPVQTLCPNLGIAVVVQARWSDISKVDGLFKNLTP